MMPDAARRRIEALAASSDALDQEVARRLAGRLTARSATSGNGDSKTERAASPWAHVNLANLLEHFGNPIRVAGERVKSGHEPAHPSKSGTCLIAWLGTGRWWCSSCGRSGDAITLVMQALGIRYPAAVEWLTVRYGPPADDVVHRVRTRRQKQRRYNAAVRTVTLGEVPHA